MKKMLIILSLFLCLACLPAAAESAQNEPFSEWTVMFYLCGSDLESQYGFASAILEDITDCYYPSSEFVTEETLHRLNPDDRSDLGDVNVVVQTGGSDKWHTQEHGLDLYLSADTLYRLCYHAQVGEKGSFEIGETLSPKSMADPETLTDFYPMGRENPSGEKIRAGAVGPRRRR